MKVRVPFRISWGYAGPRGGPCRVTATLWVLRDPFRHYRTWAKAEPYQMATEPTTIFSGWKDGDKFVPRRENRVAPDGTRLSGKFRGL